MLGHSFALDALQADMALVDFVQGAQRKGVTLARFSLG